MLLGLDVGGTFTDCVAVDGGKIHSMVKTPTTPENLLDCILHAVDTVMAETGNRKFERISLSTTMVTNAIVEGNIDRVGLCVMPGPGMNIEEALPSAPFVLSGYVDHRGREMVPTKAEEVAEACRHFSSCDVFAVSGKFAVRNPCAELAVGERIRKETAPGHVSFGGRLSGSLNFLRRTNSAYFNGAVWRQFNRFAAAIEEALRVRGVQGPVSILKADGGTLPLAVARECPVEAIFTGPAASTMGIMGMNATGFSGVSLDIGGTTTDIALWQEGRPLFAKGGATVNGYATGVRGFRLTSVGIGGDSLVFWDRDELKVGPKRCGPAMAAGGTRPTVTDAMIAAGLIDFGRYDAALRAMKELGKGDACPQEMAAAILDKAVETICHAIGKVVEEQAREPLYRVEDMVHGAGFMLDTVLGVGGGAAGLVPLVAKKIQVPYVLLANGMVANAFGAAVSRPTLGLTLRADTAEGCYTVAELGLKQKLPSRTFSLHDACQLAEVHLRELAGLNGVLLDETEVVYGEEFNMIRGFRTIGKMITCSVQVKPGILRQRGKNFA